MDYHLGRIIEFILHTCATVLTRWLKLACIIMIWKLKLTGHIEFLSLERYGMDLHIQSFKYFYLW
jgi:hypothetical protein